MPRPKQTLIALFILAAYVLCAACTETDECTQVSKDLRKFNGPPISFNFSSDMYIDLKKEEDSFCRFRNTGSNAYIRFSTYSRSAIGKTIEEALESEAKKQLEGGAESESSLSGPIANVQRRVNGQMLNGKLLRTRKNGSEFITELFMFKNGFKYIFLKFETTPEDRSLAECYFKIIADSIQWQGQSQRSGSVMLEYPGPPISFNYSSDMDIQCGRYYCSLSLPDFSALIAFTARTTPSYGKTPQEALKSEVRSFLARQKEDGYKLVEDIKDVDRSINGRMLKGKSLWLKRGSQGSDNNNRDTIFELYIYQKENHFVALIFSKDLIQRAIAEHYFKIITNSIK